MLSSFSFIQWYLWLIRTALIDLKHVFIAFKEKFEGSVGAKVVVKHLSRIILTKMTLLSLRMNIAFNIQWMSRLWSEEPSRGLFPREGSWRSTAITELIKVDETPRGVIVTEFSPQQRCPHRSMWLVCSFGHSQRSQPHRENCENGGFRRWYPEENIHFTPYQITSMYEFKENISPSWKFRNICHLEDRDPEPIYVCVSSANTHLSAHFSFSCYNSTTAMLCILCFHTYYNVLQLNVHRRCTAYNCTDCTGLPWHWPTLNMSDGNCSNDDHQL